MDWQEWQDTKKQIYDFIIENRSMYRDDGVDVGLGDIIDFLNATVTKTGRKITVDAHGWGGWPLYDYIVDDDWAETGLAEGTIINTYTGTKIYSTVQGAVDHWVSLGIGVDKSFFICPGHYVEDVDLDLDTNGAQGLHMMASAGGGTEIHGDLRLRGVYGKGGTGLPMGSIENLYVTGALILGHLTGDLANTHIDSLSVRDCSFAGGVEWEATSSSDSVHLEDCEFVNCNFGGTWQESTYTVDCDSDVRFEGCTFSTRTLFATKSPGIGNAKFERCHFLAGMKIGTTAGTYFAECDFTGDSSGNPCLHFDYQDASDWDSDMDDIVVDGCRFIYTTRSAEWAFIKIGGNHTASGNRTNLTITGNVFSVPHLTSGAAIHILWNADADLDNHPPKVAFVGNAMIEDKHGLRLEDYDSSTSVKGIFSDSVFGPNVPPNFDVVLDDTSANNIYIGTGNVTGAGASSATIIGGSSSGTTSGILYDSAALTLGYRAFVCRFDTTIVTVAAGTTALTDNATNYIEVDAAGAVTDNTAGYTLGHIPLGTVVTLSGDITTITEQSATLDESLSNLYTANSILAANATHTPQAIAVNQQEVVGRLTGGNIGGIALGILDDNILQVDHTTTAAANQYARFTANGLESRSEAEFKGDYNLEDADITALAHTEAHADFDDHSARHENAGADEIGVAGLSGELADLQPVKAHNHTAAAADGGIATDDEHDGFSEYAEIAKPANPAANKLRVYAKDDGAGVTKLYGLDSAGTETAYGAGGAGAPHAILDGSVHSDSVADGVTAGSIIIGNDTPKWDELAITVPGAANLMNVLGVVNGETTPVWKVVYDATVPSAIGTASAGTGVVAARVNHVHAADSDDVTYAPTTAADWDGAADPGDVEQALDQLAERVRNAHLWVSAKEIGPSTGTGALIDGCAYPARREYTTNGVNPWYCAFDPSTDEAGEFDFVLPVWDGGTLTATPHWTTVAAAGTTVKWMIQAAARDDNDPIDDAWGAAAACAADTVLAAGDEHKVTSAAITPDSAGTAAAGDHLYFRIYRDVSEDDCASDADLLGVLIGYNRRDA